MDVKFHITRILEKGSHLNDWLSFIDKVKTNCDRETLVQIYQCALSNVTRIPKTKEYKQLLISLANLQSQNSPAEARQTFLSAHNCDGDCAVVCVYYAQFEFRYDKVKAFQIVRKGRKEGRTPSILLKKAYKNMQENIANLFQGIANPWDDSLHDITNTATLTTVSPENPPNALSNPILPPLSEKKAPPHCSRSLTNLLQGNNTFHSIPGHLNKTQSASDLFRTRTSPDEFKPSLPKTNLRKGVIKESKPSLSPFQMDKEERDMLFPLMKRQLSLCILDNTSSKGLFDIDSKSDRKTSQNCDDESNTVFECPLQNNTNQEKADWTSSVNNVTVAECRNGDQKLSLQFENNFDISEKTDKNVDKDLNIFKLPKNPININNDFNDFKITQKPSNIDKDFNDFKVPEKVKADSDLDFKAPADFDFDGGFKIPDEPPVFSESIPDEETNYCEPGRRRSLMRRSFATSGLTKLVNEVNLNNTEDEVTKENQNPDTVIVNTIENNLQTEFKENNVTPARTNHPRNNEKRVVLSEIKSNRVVTERKSSVDLKRQALSEKSERGSALERKPSFNIDRKALVEQKYRKKDELIIPHGEVAVDRPEIFVESGQNQPQIPQAKRGLNLQPQQPQKQQQPLQPQKQQQPLQPQKQQPQKQQNHQQPTPDFNKLIQDGLKELGEQGYTTNDMKPIEQDKRNFVVKGKTYKRLALVGKGGSCKVYEVEGEGGEKYALKRVCVEELDNFTLNSYMDEIKWLEKMSGSPYIIKLYGWEKTDVYLFILMEKGDRDLANILNKTKVLTQIQLKNYWHQMLSAVLAIHEVGIVHADLKPANFLFVKDKLKLIDFGIANGIQADKTSVTREYQMGTLNYMPPEAISEDVTRISRLSDVWSLGCILYLMVFKKTPYQEIRNQTKKIMAIRQGNNIDFSGIRDQNLLHCLKGCLKYEKNERLSVENLLQHPFLKNVTL